MMEGLWADQCYNPSGAQGPTPNVFDIQEPSFDLPPERAGMTLQKGEDAISDQNWSHVFTMHANSADVRAPFGSELLPFCLLDERENHGGSDPFLDNSSIWQSGNMVAQNKRISLVQNKRIISLPQNKRISSSKARISSAQNKRISSSKARAAYRSESRRYTHIMTERHRREDLNEKFSILRTILPKLTKKDKASILEDTRNYIMELQKKVKYLQDFKFRLKTQGPKSCCNIKEIVRENLKAIKSIEHVPKEYNQDGNVVPQIEIQSMGSQAMIKVVCPRSQIEIQSMGSQAMIKVVCPRSRGLVLRTHKALVDCRVEVMQSNVTTLENNAVHSFTVQLNPGVSANNDEIISALEEATGNGR